MSRSALDSIPPFRAKLHTLLQNTSMRACDGFERNVTRPFFVLFVIDLRGSSYLLLEIATKASRYHGLPPFISNASFVDTVHSEYSSRSVKKDSFHEITELFLRICTPSHSLSLYYTRLFTHKFRIFQTTTSTCAEALNKCYLMLG